MISLNLLGLISLVIVLLTILVRSADLIEDAFVFLANKLKVREFAIGFFILSTVSSLPEFSIAISANDLSPELSIGNLVGATVILLTLVIGLTAIKFKEVAFTHRFGRNQITAGVFFIALGALSFLDGTLSIMDGFLIFGVFILYALFVSREFKFFSALLSSKNRINSRRKVIDVESLLEMLIKAVIGITLILISSNLLVDAAIELAGENYLNINPTLIGIFVFAIGTNIPELTFLFRANQKNEVLLSLGNVAGSATLNTLILGFLAILSEGVVLSDESIFSLVPVLVAYLVTLVTFLIFSWSQDRITKREGFILLSIYLALVLGQLIFLINA